MYVAALDTCVLWPSLQRDFMLSMAVENVYRPVWSDVVLEELVEHEALKLQRRHRHGVDEAEQRAHALIAQMELVFEGATVTDWATVRPVGLPDVDDEHVVGAAVRAGADVIVTDNLKHFPGSLLPEGLQARSAADFIDAMVLAQPSEASAALRQMSARRKGPVMSPADVIDLLELRYELHVAADVLRRWI